MKTVQEKIASELQPGKKSVVFDKVKLNSEFNIGFISLLVSSTIICTLGLLLNSTATIIGGMIISPLMWPLMQLSLGLSYGKKRDIISMLSSLFISIIIIIVTAFIIAFLSPIKAVNSEILARTSPNLLYLIVALVSGGIATLAVTRSRISESLAGVAIASSLLPPLCVVGIGLALTSVQIATGSFLFFFANLLSSIFMAIVVFSFIGFKSKKAKLLRRETLAFTAIALVITAIPLYTILKDQSFEILAYNKIELNLESELLTFSEDIKIENIETNFDTENTEVLNVNVELLIPENININYQQQQQLATKLEEEVGREINLNLTLTRSITILSETGLQKSNTEKLLSETFVAEVNEELPNYTVTTYEAKQVGDTWIITSLLAGDPELIISDGHLARITQDLSETINSPVKLNTSIVPIIDIQAQEDILLTEIKDTIIEELKAHPLLEINEIVLEPNPDKDVDKISLKLVITYPTKADIDDLNLEEIIERIENLNSINLETSLEVIRKDIFEI